MRDSMMFRVFVVCTVVIVGTTILKRPFSGTVTMEEPSSRRQLRELQRPIYKKVKKDNGQYLIYRCDKAGDNCYFLTEESEESDNDPQVRARDSTRRKKKKKNRIKQISPKESLTPEWANSFEAIESDSTSQSNLDSTPSTKKFGVTPRKSAPAPAIQRMYGDFFDGVPTSYPVFTNLPTFGKIPETGLAMYGEGPMFDDDDMSPTLRPTRTPTFSDIPTPRMSKVTDKPSPSPTVFPTDKPSPSPTVSPTDKPSPSPTYAPTEKSPTMTPTDGPTVSPTASPTKKPTASPTASPTKTPTDSPSSKPTMTGSEVPTIAASDPPTVLGSEQPTQVPSTSVTESTANPTILRLPFDRVGDIVWGDLAKYNFFGYAVDMDVTGKRIAVGGPMNGRGSVFVYGENPSGEWVALGNGVEGQGWGCQFGSSVSLSDDGGTLAVGAPYDQGDGAAYVYKLNENADQWVPIGSPILGHSEVDVGDQFGKAIALAGINSERLVVAAGVGMYIEVYEISVEGGEAKWVLRWTVPDKVGEVSVRSIAISGNGQFVAVGNSATEGNKGSVNVYNLHRDGSIQAIGQTLTGSGPNQKYGMSVDLSSNGLHLLVATPIDSTGGGALTGLVQVHEYDKSAATWNQVGQDMKGSNTLERAGYSAVLSPDATTVAYSALGHQKTPSYARMMKYFPDKKRWLQIGEDVMEKEYEVSFFGWSVAASADRRRIVVGAPLSRDKEGKRIGLGVVGVYNRRLF